MRQATLLLTIGAAAVCTSAASAQHWVNFVNETSTRLVADSNVGANNVDEKDYAYGDLDHDGDTDLVCVMKQPFTSPGKRRNVLYMNEGMAQGHAINGVLVDRTAARAPQMLDLTNDRDVVFVDVNGDGWLDVVTATTLSGVPQGTNGDKHNSHPRIYINLGQSNSQPPPLSSTWLGLSFDDDNRVPLQPTEPRFCAVSAGDIDNDGDKDLYFGDYQQGGNRSSDLNDRLWINDGNGYFTDQSEARMTFEMRESSFGMATQIADMNNDGFLDIIKDDALNSPQAVSISYNNPANPGFFSVYDLPHGHQPYHVVVGNLNNDGLLDMVVSDDFLDRYRLGTGIVGGKETFSDHTFTFSGGGGDDGFASDNYIADLDNDGWNDVVICDVDVDISGNNGCSDGRRMHVYRNLGGTVGGFVSLQEQIIGGQPVGGISTANLVGMHDVAIFDINGDGALDMVCGRCSGTQVWINQPPDGLQFSYPGGLPGLLAPNTPTTFEVQLAGGGGTPVPGSGSIFLSINGGAFNEIAMNHLGGNLYEATLPAGECADGYRFYFAGESTSGNTFTDPPQAGAAPYTAIVAEEIVIAVDDNIEGDVSGWSVSSHRSLTSGAWEAVNPVGTLTATTLLQAAPEDDAGSGAQVTAWVTQNGAPGQGASVNDVDGGPAHLVTPAFDLADSDANVSYARWFFWEGGTADSMVVAISNNDGASWTTVETVTTAASQWITESFRVSDFVVPTAQMRVRFSVSDSPNNSVTEGGIDNFVVEEFVCGATPCAGDAVSNVTFQPPGDGTVDAADLAFLLGEWGPNPGSSADTVSNVTFQPPPDGVVDAADLAFLLGAWGPCN
jgi:hypothetical protein